MRASRIDRVKRRLVQEAIAENLDTIRGLPPRSIRFRERARQRWMRRIPIFVVLIGLAGTTWVASNPVPVTDTIPPAQIVIRRSKPAPPQVSSIDPGPLSLAALPLSVRRVVVDAGHGGTDPGTVSALRHTEKEITLDISNRLGELLRSRGFEVVATRQDDTLIPLRERARVANETESDIFVSIHVNALEKFPMAHGVETYYLGPTDDPTLTELAASENRESGYSVADLRKLLDGIYADARRDESKRLAEAVQNQLYSRLRVTDSGLRNWGVKKAPFIVLVATEMPAVLAEVGCMTNEKEAALLRRPEYRQQIAEALFEGIHAYASAADAPLKKGS